MKYRATLRVANNTVSIPTPRQLYLNVILRWDRTYRVYQHLDLSLLSTNRREGQEANTERERED